MFVKKHRPATKWTTIAAPFAITIATLLALASGSGADTAPTYGWTEHDFLTSTSSEAAAALTLVKAFGKKPLRSGAEAIALYRAEEKIGAFRMSSVEEFKDERLVLDCNSYVEEHRARFREVHDGWKGDRNYFEPNSHWADSLRKLLPEAPEAREMHFDLKFKDLQREFRHDSRAIGKDCATFYRDLLRSEPMFSESYAPDEIATMAPSCESQRAKYIRRRDELLKNFGDLPAARKLERIDATEVVSEKYFGLC
jgi:hypothetical protein